MRLKVGEDGNVLYEGTPYNHHEFVRTFSHLLEIRHLEWDHLQKGEWEVLHPNIPWEKKQQEIGFCRSDKSRLEESKKCQLICSLSHIRVSRARELAARYDGQKFYKPYSKEKYIRQRKQELTHQCSHCGEIYDDVPSFLEFNHITLDNKIASIYHMERNSPYTIDDIRKEIDERCVLLCRHCHTLETSKQREDGTIQRKAMETKKRRKLEKNSNL